MSPLNISAAVASGCRLIVNERTAVHRVLSARWNALGSISSRTNAVGQSACEDRPVLRSLLGYGRLPACLCTQRQLTPHNTALITQDLVGESVKQRSKATVIIRLRSTNTYTAIQ